MSVKKGVARMPSIRKEDAKKQVVWSWGNHVDQMIREAQERGEFVNLPDTGKPLTLDDNVFAGEMQSAYRLAKTANAAPLWVALDGEIGLDGAALAAMLERTAAYLEKHAAQLRAALAAVASQRTSLPLASARPRWWPFRRAAMDGKVNSRQTPDSSPQFDTLHSLEEERLRARGLYLQRAAELDEKIVQYNSNRPRSLSWLEKTRLTPAGTARQFDARIPPLV
ncbi:MAG TPA: DUF1992 domain-containing protein [Chloroflexota bacterium]|nr:DUF1992 domain-containing protein [Chloroflexota bacterium]